MVLGHVHSAGQHSTRTCYDLAGKAGKLWVARGCRGVLAQRPRLEETGCQAAYCKHAAQQTHVRCHDIVSCSTSLIQTHTLHTLRGL